MLHADINQQKMCDAPQTFLFSTVAIVLSRRNEKKEVKPTCTGYSSPLFLYLSK